MTGAFADIPEPLADAEPPLEAMLSCNARLLHHSATLRRLVLYLGECGCDVQAQLAIGQLLRFFGKALPRHHADQEEDLVPALLESMAGSDAVCLGEIGDAIAAGHRELQRLWLRLRPALEDAAAGRAGALAAQEVENFVERCRSCVEQESGALAMAARLLSEQQLEQVARTMHARRVTPT